jgi:hypothetical protein
MKLDAGSRWKSAVSDVEVIVIKAPASDVSLQCGGHDMRPLDVDGELIAVVAGLDDVVAAGKRYSGEGVGIELLVTKSGHGTLCVDGTPLELKSAKPLPSSD